MNHKQLARIAAVAARLLCDADVLAAFVWEMLGQEHVRTFDDALHVAECELLGVEPPAEYGGRHRA